MALPEKNIETTIVASKFDDNGQSQVKNCTRIWPEYEHFKQQLCDFHMDKNNFPENWILYIDQGYLTAKDNKRMFYAHYYILDQIIEAINPPKKVENYVCKDREVRFYHPRYDTQTGQFLGLYESVGYLIVKGDD